MKISSVAIVILLIGICSVFGQTNKSVSAKKTMKVAKGTFEVKITPLTAEENVGDASIGRLALEKTFAGDLVGTSKGQMLGIGTDIKESGGYVAAERLNVTLEGRKGTFALQHSGTMQGGKFDLNVIVVPDSGTGDLVGITGKLKIIIEKGNHFYELEYSLPEKK